MDTFLQVITVVAMWSALTIGVGALVCAAAFVWSLAFDQLLTLFRIKKLFVQFIYDYYRHKRSRSDKPYKPTINRKGDE